MRYKKQKRMSKREKDFRSIAPGSPSGATVVDGDLKYALQTWKRATKDSGTMRELYKRREYVKPSVKRRKILNDAIHKQRYKNNDGEY